MTGLTERQLLALVKKKTKDDALLLDVNKRNASGETPLHQAAIKVLLVVLVCVCGRNACVFRRWFV